MNHTYFLTLLSSCPPVIDSKEMQIICKKTHHECRVTTLNNESRTKVSQNNHKEMQIIRRETNNECKESQNNYRETQNDCEELIIQHKMNTKKRPTHSTVGVLFLCRRDVVGSRCVDTSVPGAPLSRNNLSTSVTCGRLPVDVVCMNVALWLVSIEMSFCS